MNDINNKNNENKENNSYIDEDEKKRMIYNK